MTAVNVIEMLEALVEHAGSDLLLQAGAEPVLRVDGVLVRLKHPPLTPEQTRAIVSELLPPGRIDVLDERRQLDFIIVGKEGIRFRANAFYQRETISVAVRLLPNVIPSLLDLGMPAVVHDLIELPRGLVLVTGPTGAGKSTTLAAMLGAINQARACHIITIEDPIEFVHRNARSLIDQREVGRDALSFETALHSIFREDPDVVLIGEMRDQETIASALTIAETGHLVFATLHTNDSSQAIDRIVDVFPGERQQQIRVQLAGTLAGIIYQQLLPAQSGGRVAAFEILIASNAVRNLIKDNKSNQIRNVLSTSAREGMQTLERSLSQLYADKLVTLEDAKARSLFPDEVK